MTASSSCSGTVDNFWSRDDIRVHTFGGFAQGREVLARDLFEGKPTRTAGAKRRGAEAARQPVPASRRKTALATRRHGADQDAKTRMTWNATSAWSLTPSCANCLAVNMSHGSVINLDDVPTIPASCLGDLVGYLYDHQESALHAAIVAAFDLDDEMA